MVVKLAGPENQATASDGHSCRQPVVSLDNEEVGMSESHPAVCGWTNQHSRAVAASAGLRAEWLKT